MRFLLHGTLTPAVADALRRHQDTPVTVAEAGIDGQDIAQLLEQANQKQLDLITNDPQLSHAIFEQRLSFSRSIVYLQLAGEDVEQDDAIDRLYERYKRLTPGRLYTVTGSRVKIRQLPGKK